METVSVLLAICAGNSPGPLNSPHKGQWRGALMFFIYLRLNKRLSKQSWGWWFETLSRPLWSHCNASPTFELFSQRQVVHLLYISEAAEMVNCRVVREIEIFPTPTNTVMILIYHVNSGMQWHWTFDRRLVFSSYFHAHTTHRHLPSRITMTSSWASWRVKSPASRLFILQLIQAQIKENVKASRHWPLWGELTSDRWIRRTRGP